MGEGTLLKLSIQSGEADWWCGLRNWKAQAIGNECFGLIKQRTHEEGVRKPVASKGPEPLVQGGYAVDEFDGNLLYPNVARNYSEPQGEMSRAEKDTCPAYGLHMIFKGVR